MKNSIVSHSSLFLAITRKLVRGLVDRNRLGAVAVGLLLSAAPAWAQSNPITVENAKTGNPSSQWDIVGAGDLSIQGFATDISVNKGGTIQFKIDTDATSYRLDIYRLGYYGGMGARFIQSVSPSATLPQLQPDPLTDAATGLIDCGNWAVSASWTVPATATSGLYIAKLVRTDSGGTGEGSHIAFVVRDDASTSDIIFQTSDTTWQAYNSYGGNSLYVGNPAGRAYKVSYNRPFITRAGDTNHDWIFNAEYPMVRWLESNGYNVSYTTGVDSDRRGNLLLQHKLFLSVGHDEYWSGNQRANVEAARNAGVNLAFFSGNEMFWKTRWENSIDGSGTAYRTLVCYKETHANAKIDPTSAWTGTWRDPRFSPPADGGRPENAVTGTLFTVNGPNETMSVPASYGAHRFWRGTGIDTQAANATATLPFGTLGYEWDEVPDNGFRPSGLMVLSKTTFSGVDYLQDLGSTYAPGTATHQLTLYRHTSGALVFGAGTIQWSWGLDSSHDNGNLAASPAMRQATVNLFADMTVQPATIQAGLTIASASSDITAPTSTIQSPAAGASLVAGSVVTISGTASDTGGGKVWSVEVSTDNGATWHPATGQTSWTYAWSPAQTGSYTLKSRAVDDSGNLQTPGAGVTVTVTGSATVSIWPATTVPVLVDGGPDGSVELGVKFKSDVAGKITGIRFYKASNNTGTHVGNLWSSTGTLLATATFSSETTSGWQQILFSSPVSIAANTTYIASYHANNGHYSADLNYFASAGFDRAPLHALANGVSINGVYAYGSSSVFPNQTWNAANYWVDVVFQLAPVATLTSIAVTPANPTAAVGTTQQFTATGTYSDATTQNLTSSVTWASATPARATITSAGLASAVSVGTTSISAISGSITGSTTLTVTAAPLAISTGSLANGTAGTAYSATLTATGGTTPYTWSILSGALPTGLTLNASTGALTGTPTAKGTFSFTAQVTDTGSPVQTVSKALSIVITATLSSIAVTPVTPTVTVGATQQFTATGTYSDATTQNLTAQVTWASATPARATITSAGLASAVSVGTTSISATFGSVSGSTTLTIQAVPIAISTASLASGTTGTVYSATLAATGGTTPYTWSILSGSLPTGLTLNASTGAITGTPSAAGTFAFTAQVTDVGSPVQTVSKSLSIVIAAAPTTVTIWPSTTIPGLVDGGVDSPVELGVKFKSDVAGTITGIRFYKASTNTGVHIGNLWSSTGTLLATATFSSESASGWQQVLFSSPVTITANTTYVASYHVNGGHYSADLNYFLSTGFDRAPLHALANGISINGVYAYGSSSVFPNQTWSAANYWVDVVFQPAVVATLTSIAVTPVSPTVTVGATQQFTATGTYSDATTQNLTSSVTWATATPARATITSAGLASAVSLGTTSISATSGSITGSTTLTVTAAPLAISTSSLANGTAGTAYSATLAATGGTTPYTWSILTGALPTGLTLDASTGAITGTPTVKGTFSFTAQVTDTGSPVQPVSKALSIVITATLSSIAVTPVSPTVTVGATQQFTATGTYSDATTQNLTAQVTWASSVTARATINSAGLASTVSVGTTTISATFGSVSGSTTLTIQAVPIAISTTSLASGTTASAYSATLAATGGTTPYTWSILSGSLPTGLTLNASTGALTGTPTAAGTFAFTAQVTDVGSPVQIVSKALSIVIAAAPTTVTIWPSTTVPGLVDGGVDSPVELGLKFKSDVAGTINGLRFYKATTNTGVHIGNLWSSTGTLLATATFSSESASGWQQVLFSSPVTITANTTYVASYHVNGGHYSADLNYFLSAGFDRAPLHALANGVSINGVYAYGSSSVFPNQTWSAANYWVDVVFQPAVVATLTSIAITPANPTAEVGTTQQFTATGIYSDATTQNLTGSVTWASATPDRATITSTGLATAVSGGTTTISATSGSITGSTTLTVTAAPLAISTASLASGTAGTVYSATLAATGGTTPYTWSILTGALPTGLTLNASTGAITGTPTIKGTFSFTAQVTDTGSQTVSKALSIVITATLNSIAITPATPTATVGATQQFTATGTYSDATTQDLTSQVTWASATPACATLNSAGLATTVSVGTTSISATFGGVSGSTTLTIQAVPIAISTASLASGTTGTVYSATLAATGGTTPYTWSILSGSLPTGLTLNASTGAITGTPSAAGTFAFTAQVTDVGSPVQTVSKSLSIVIAAAPTTVTIWPSTTIPGLVDGGVDSPVELGVKFKSDVAGTITGIRFYKASTNTGVHIGNLWSSTGTLLATATFSSETASGWQQVSFSSPVYINANTVYIASYHTNVGHYSGDVDYFSARAVDNPPLHALANGSAGSNGVFGYGATSVFPTQAWQATNYWVDVLFSPGAGQDNLPPTVVATSPQSGSSGVPPTTAINITFNEPVDVSTVTNTTVVLRDSLNAIVPTTVSYVSATNTAVLTPSSPLNMVSNYTIVAKGGTSGIADTSGNKLAADYTSTFSTVTYGAVGGGPGGPILVLTNDAHAFSKYYAEILLAEGLNSFALADVSTISADALAAYDVVLLGETALTPAQVTLLTDWVNAGGNLIAMRPDKQLAGLLGLVDGSSTLSEGYLLVNTSSGPGAGIVNDTIQYHDVADSYTLGSATSVATFYSADAVTPTSNPAVTLRNVGSNGGQAAAFTFDLAKSIVYTRQGNPAWVDQSRDGATLTRSHDLFYGAATFDPQPDWVNLDKVAIPQADEQQHLLANLIIAMNSAKRPLPRFWFFPHGYKAAVVMTGDDHGTFYGGFGGTRGRFDIYQGYSPENGSVDDWETIRSTSYVFPGQDGALTDGEAVAYTAAGFELSVHLYTHESNYTAESLDALFTDQISQFKSQYPSLGALATHRAHAIVWCGYTTMPEVELLHGIRLDTNYYFWPAEWVQDRPGMFTGSGLPMRFSSAQGNVIDVYQATTQMTDESGQSFPFNIDTLLDHAVGPEGYYGAFVANMHTDFPNEQQSDDIILSAVSHGVPVISARQLLTWTDARNSSAIKSIAWNGNTLTFAITADTRAKGLQTMIPLVSGQTVTSVQFNGAPLAYELKLIKGVQYVVIPTLSGNYQIVVGTTP